MPKKKSENKERTSIVLEKHLLELARALGGGNVSKGIALALKFTGQRHWSIWSKDDEHKQ